MDRTDWERKQYDADHGRHAEFAQALAGLSAIIRAHPEMPLPGWSDDYPLVINVPVSGRTEEECFAAVDAFAAGFGVTAQWRHDGHDYRARLRIGPVAYDVYRIPDSVMAGTYARDSYRQNVQVEAVPAETSAA